MYHYLYIWHVLCCMVNDRQQNELAPFPHTSPCIVISTLFNILVHITHLHIKLQVLNGSSSFLSVLELLLKFNVDCALYSMDGFWCLSLGLGFQASGTFIMMTLVRYSHIDIVRMK